MIKDRKPEGYNLGAVAGIKHERERIIKLLEQRVANWPNGKIMSQNIIEAIMEGTND